MHSAPDPVGGGVLRRMKKHLIHLASAVLLTALMTQLVTVYLHVHETGPGIHLATEHTFEENSSCYICDFSFQEPFFQPDLHDGFARNFSSFLELAYHNRCYVEVPGKVCLRGPPALS